MFYTDFLKDIEEGNIEKVKRFFIEYPDVSINKNQKYAMGATWIFPLPLIVAFQNNRLDVARELIEHGAELDIRCVKTRKTPREIMPKDF